jgi:hypothetical protein
MSRSQINYLESFASKNGEAALASKLSALQAQAAEHRGENGKGNVPKGLAKGIRHTKAAYHRVFGEKPPKFNAKTSRAL